LGETYDKLFYYMFALGLPLAAGSSLLSEELIFTFYGPHFTPSVDALKILGWDAFLMFILCPLNMTFVSINKEKEMNICS